MRNYDRSELIQVALGQLTADLVIRNGTLVNVYTAELMPGMDVALKGERIAYVGPNAAATIGPGTLVIDAEGKVIAPGFIESHTHVDCYFTLAEYLRFALPAGTTTTVCDATTMANALGYEGVLAYIDNIRRLPVNLFTAAQPTTPPQRPFESSVGLTEQEVLALLDEPEVIALGETFFTRLVERDPTFVRLVDGARTRGKVIEGHTAGAKGDRLVACAAAGIDSCHEPITLQEALDRVRLGMYAMIRCGSQRDDLTAIAPIKDAGIDLRRVILVTDGVWPDTMVNEGIMDSVVQGAIDLGFDPVRAIQMVTLNPAEYFGLSGDLGGIAPGKMADIVILDSLQNIKCEYVFARGEMVAQEGKLLIQLEKDRYPEHMHHSMHIKPDLSAQDFRIPVGIGDGRVKARALNILGEIILAGAEVEVPAMDGALQAAPEEDVVKAALFNRNREDGPRFVGLLKGYGLKTGAMGTTVAWDCYQLLIVGADEEDMARVGNHLIEVGGGTAVFDKGKMLAELRYPVGGIINCDLSVEQVGEGFRQIQQAARALGVTQPDPFLSLQTFTMTALPYVRITESGLLDVRARRILEMLIND